MSEKANFTGGKSVNDTSQVDRVRNAFGNASSTADAKSAEKDGSSVKNGGSKKQYRKSYKSKSGYNAARGKKQKRVTKAVDVEGPEDGELDFDSKGSAPFENKSKDEYVPNFVFVSNADSQTKQHTEPEHQEPGLVVVPSRQMQTDVEYDGGGRGPGGPTIPPVFDGDEKDSGVSSQSVVVEPEVPDGVKRVAGAAGRTAAVGAVVGVGAATWVGRHAISEFKAGLAANLSDGIIGMLKEVDTGKQYVTGERDSEEQRSYERLRGNMRLNNTPPGIVNMTTSSFIRGYQTVRHYNIMLMQGRMMGMTPRMMMPDAEPGMMGPGRGRGGPGMGY